MNLEYKRKKTLGVSRGLTCLTQHLELDHPTYDIHKKYFSASRVLSFESHTFTPYLGQGCNLEYMVLLQNILDRC